MKKISSIICVICMLCGSFSCSDILETESTRQDFDPSIVDKTDSLFYSFGIFEAMQQLADQYVLQGEMRGDLVSTTQYADSMLTQLASYTATTANRYDSAYVYYRVINNCNYYIAHRDTTLFTGAINVSINEYAAVKAIRAWAYLQLARNYGKVPFFTEPLTEISRIDNNTFPELDLTAIVGQLAPDLERYTGFFVPTAGLSNHETIAPNWEGTKKSFSPSRCFIPVDVILGDMYLETGDYQKAAHHFETYLTQVSTNPTSYYAATRIMDRNSAEEIEVKRTPAMTSWSSIFQRNATNDIISYISLAANAQYGPTTQVPLIFGADYYATPDEQTGYSRRNCINVAGTQRYWNYSLPLVTNVQVVPSKELTELSDSTEYYYYAYGGQYDYDSIRSANIGDMRLRNVLALYEEGENTMQWITKYDFATVILYRTSTVLLHLAEAYNRMGMYDVAFAILKDGISEVLLRADSLSSSAPYMQPESKAYLQATLLADASLFPLGTACGIHCHGAGKAASDLAETNYRQNRTLSPYRLDRIVGKKLSDMAQRYGVSVGTTKADTINAIEDLLCDEYALEFAFEGNRYFDLLRLARHKNDGSDANNIYGADFGTLWLTKKLGHKGWDVSKMYLPFK